MEKKIVYLLSVVSLLVIALIFALEGKVSRLGSQFTSGSRKVEAFSEVPGYKIEVVRGSDVVGILNSYGFWEKGVVLRDGSPTRYAVERVKVYLTEEPQKNDLYARTDGSLYASTGSKIDNKTLHLYIFLDSRFSTENTGDDITSFVNFLALKATYTMADPLESLEKRDESIQKLWRPIRDKSAYFLRVEKVQ